MEAARHDRRWLGGAEVIRAAAHWLAGLALAAAPHALAGEPPVQGYLRVDGPGVTAVVQDRGVKFKVAERLPLFQLTENHLIGYFPVNGDDEQLVAFKWNKFDAPAWITDQRQIIFGQLTFSTQATLSLEEGERLPVVRTSEKFYRVRVVRNGLAADVTLPKKTKGLTYVAGPPPVAAPVTAATTRVRYITNESIERMLGGDHAAGTMPDRVTPLPPPVAGVEPVAATGGVRVAAGHGPASPSSFVSPVPVSALDMLRNLALLACASLAGALLYLRVRERRNQPAPGPTGLAGAVAAGEAAATAAVPYRRIQLKVPEPSSAATIILDHDSGIARPGRAALELPRRGPKEGDRVAGVLWIGKYAVEELIGRGRMGVVYKAHQKDLNRTVALKLLVEGNHATHKQKERFSREAQAIARLRHPNIVAVHEVGEWESQPYFTMEFIDGTALDKVVAHERLKGPEAARLCRKLAEAIHYAHTNNIIHRDLKPGNIIIERDGGEPIITDFGLARNIDEDVLTLADDILGTPAFMSPEQAMGRSSETDARSDVYSLGAVLYSTLTGKDPFAGASLLETLQMVIHQKPTPPAKHDPTIDPRLAAICMKAMQKDRRKRYQSAQEFADDLGAYIEGAEAGFSWLLLWHRIRQWRPQWLRRTEDAA